MARSQRHARGGFTRTLASLAACALLLVAVAVPRDAIAAAFVQVQVDPPVAEVGQDVRVMYSVRIRNETGAQVGALDFGTLELLSDPSPPQLPMMWGGGFALSIDTSSEYIVRANAPGRYAIGGARVFEAQSGRVIAQQPPVTLVVRAPPGTPGADEDAGVEPNVPPPPPPDPDAPPAGDLSGAFYDPNAFLRVGVDNPNPYLGQQITLRVWLYVASSEANCELTQEPSLPGFWNEALLPPTRECAARWFTTYFGGRYMSVGLVRKIALFPSQTGRLTIGPALAAVEMITGGMFRSMQRLQVRSPDLQIEVREPPVAGRPADYVPGTIGPIQLSAEVDRPNGAVGETFAFTVHAMSDGSLASATVTPPGNIDGVRIRAGGTRARHDSSGDHVISTLESEILVVPERPGRFELGAVQIPYWDPGRGVYDIARAVLPPIVVTGAPLPRDDSARAQDPQSELRPIDPSPALRPHATWFPSGLWAIATIVTPPIALGLFLSIGALARVIGRRQRERAEEKRTDPVEIAAEARRKVKSDRATAVSLAGRALDRALADVHRHREGGLGSFTEATRALVDEARAACDAARFAGAEADANDLVTRVDRAVRAIEAES